VFASLADPTLTVSLETLGVVMVVKLPDKLSVILPLVSVPLPVLETLELPQLTHVLLELLTVTLLVSVPTVSMMLTVLPKMVLQILVTGTPSVTLKMVSALIHSHVEPELPLLIMLVVFPATLEVTTTTVTMVELACLAHPTLFAIPTMVVVSPDNQDVTHPPRPASLVPPTLTALPPLETATPMGCATIVVPSLVQPPVNPSMVLLADSLPTLTVILSLVFASTSAPKMAIVLIPATQDANLNVVAVLNVLPTATAQ